VEQEFPDPFAADSNVISLPAPRRQPFPFRTYGPDEIAHIPDAEVEWIVRGIVGKGVVTELTADVRAGKTTFAGEMVRAMRERRPFLGQPSTWAPVTWLTEERPQTFLKAMRRAHLETCDADEVRIAFRLDVASLKWPALLQHVLAEHKRRAGPGLLIVDTLSRFVGVGPDQENDPAVAAVAMEPLLHCARAGMAVLVHRHSRKSGGDVATAGRGSSAWSADCDIMLRVRRVPRPEGAEEDLADRSRSRLLEAASRFTETPGQDEPCTILLSPDGYGLVDGDTSRRQRTEDLDEQVLLYLASHPGYTRTDARRSDLIRAKASLIDQRIQALLERGRLVERLVPRTDARGYSRQVTGLFLGPNA